jgi:DNA-binding LacI/PurR family transcriptional regulator
VKVTIKDIARAAGVSYQTVSKALLGRDEVNEATAERIRQIAKEQGYIPSLAARAMATKKSRLIAVFLPQIASSFYNKFLQGIENLANQHDYSILLYLFENTNLEDKLENILSYHVEGIVIFENHFSLHSLEQFQANNIPLLFVNSTDIPPNASHIAIDGYYGLKLVFEHLYALKHRHILLALSDHEAEMKRIEDIKKLPTEYDLTVKSKVYCDYYSSAEVFANFRVEDLPKEISAIVCTSDYIALPIMTKLQEQGVKVPDEISIVGFDDLEFAAFLSPPLTTIEQPKREFGEKIFQTLFGLMQGESNQSTVIFPRLIIRGTTRGIEN